MNPKLRRFLRAGAIALAGAALAAATVWVNVMAGLGPQVLGFGHGMTPSIPVTPLSLAIEVALRGLLLVPPLAVLAMISGPWPLRAISVLLFAYGWYFIADDIAFSYAIDFGATWRPGEPFAELFYRPLLTPALWIGASLAYLWLLSRLNRVPVTGRRAAG